MIQDATINSREVKKIKLDHWQLGCDCGHFRFISAKVRGTEYSICIPYCIHVSTGSGFRAGIEELEKVTGLHIINMKSAKELCRIYGASPYDLDELEPVIDSGFGCKEFIKRDVVKLLFKKNSIQRKKCEICLGRNCRNRDHHFMRQDRGPAKDTGYVYFLLHETTQFCKVGYSSEIHKRIRTLKVSTPGRMRLIGAVKGSYDLERNIHEELEQFRVPGHKEWFFFSDYVKKYVENLVKLWGEVDGIGTMKEQDANCLS